MSASGKEPVLGESWQLRQYAQRRRSMLLLEREPYMADWMEVSDYVDPSRGRFNEQPPALPGRTEGVTRRKRSRRKIINNTATNCVRTAAAGFSSHMTSKSRPWFEVDAPNPQVNDLHDVRVWMDEVTAAIRTVMAKSNFYKAMPDSYTEDLLFGVTAMLMPEDDDDVVRWDVLTVGTYAIALGANGKADTLYHDFQRTARQLETLYGRGNLPEQVTRCLDQGGFPDTVFTVSSLIEPNPDVRPGLGPLGLQAERFRPWRQIVWLMGQANQPHGCLTTKGFYEQPFVAARFMPVSDEVYSSSPVLDSLGDIKQLQYNEGTKLKVNDLIAEPPLGLPASMRNNPASLSPRSKTYLPDGQMGVEAKPLYTPDPRALNALTEDRRDVEARIQNTLFYPLFLMLSSLDDRDRTATEIAERRDERATVLGPTVEVVTDELLDPSVVRVFRALERRGMIPPAPPALANIPLKIEYTSILAQAMKASGIDGIQRTIQFAAGVVQATGDASLFDKLDMDEAVSEFSERVSAPAVILRSDDQVAAIRQAAAQQKQMAQMAQMAKPMSDAAKAMQTMATTVPEDGAMLGNLAEQMAGAGA